MEESNTENGVTPEEMMLQCGMGPKEASLYIHLERKGLVEYNRSNGSVKMKNGFISFLKSLVILARNTRFW